MWQFHTFQTAIMGCVSSNQAQLVSLQRQLHHQKEQLAALQAANAHLKGIIEGIQADKKKQMETRPPDWSAKVKELEGKVEELEKRVEEKEDSGEDTFSRGSRADSPPDILLESRALESAPQSEARSSHTIMDDPMIREMYERKRQMFLLKKTKESAGEQDSQPQISPTMTSTHVSNKPA
jgi:chromosome segregation ATPase